MELHMFQDLDPRRWGDLEILMDNGVTEEQIDKMLDLKKEENEWEVVKKTKRKDKTDKKVVVEKKKSKLIKPQNKKIQSSNVQQKNRVKQKKVFKNDRI